MLDFFAVPDTGLLWWQQLIGAAVGVFIVYWVFCEIRLCVRLKRRSR